MKYLCLLMSLTSIFIVFSVNNTAKAKNKKIVTVFVDKIKKKKIFDEYVYPVKISPRVKADILAESHGIVSDLYASIGKKVKNGEKLFNVKHTDPVYQYRPIISKSPVNGVVSNTYITEGSTVSRGTKVMTVVDPSKFSILIEVTSQDLPYIKNGLLGYMSLNGGKTVNVRVKGVSPYVDSATGTATTELELTSEKDKGSIIIGSLGKVRFRSNIRNGISISEDVVYYKGKKTLLRVVNDDKKVSYKSITLGKKFRGSVEIIKGAKDGQDYVVRASGYISEGDTVKIGKKGK